MKTENSRKITGTALCLCAAVLIGCSKESDFGSTAETNLGIVFEVNVAGDQEEVARTRSSHGAKAFDSENFYLRATVTENEENPFTAVRSRATEVTEDAFYDTFGVYAYIYDSEESWADNPSAKLYIDNGTVSQSGGSWTFDAVRYRPSDAYRLTFFAYAPTALEETTDGSLEVSLDESSNLPQIAYTVPSSYAEQKDLVVATATDQTKSENSVSLEFNHILTAVQVKCGSMPEGTISNITFSGIKNRGTYDLAEESWTLVDDTTSYEVTGNFTAAKSAEILTGDSTLMLLPQRLGEDAAVTVTYTPTDGEEMALTASLYQEDLDEGEQEWEQGKKITYLITFRDLNGYEAVDLGLSVVWATCNVGADSESGYGSPFAWSEITTRSSFTSGSYTNHTSLTEATVKGNPLYDAATANWGGAWRMPTQSEQKELYNNCTFSSTTVNGVKGAKFTGPNGNSIFLPYCGYFYSGSTRYTSGSRGNYWSCTPNTSSTSQAKALWISSSSPYKDSREFSRYCGMSVRAVAD